MPEDIPKQEHAAVWKNRGSAILLAGVFALVAGTLSLVVGAWGDEAMALSTAGHGPVEAVIMRALAKEPEIAMRV